MNNQQRPEYGSKDECRSDANRVGEVDGEGVAVSTLAIDDSDELLDNDQVDSSRQRDSAISGSAWPQNDAFRPLVQSVISFFARTYPKGRTPYALAAGSDVSDLADLPGVNGIDLTSTSRLASLKGQHAQDDPRSGFGICAIEIGIQNLSAVTDALAEAYQLLQPDGLVILICRRQRGLSWKGLHERFGVNSRVEMLRTQLFREGFERPRLDQGRGYVTLAARRSPHEPPYRRVEKLSVVMPVFNEKRTFSSAIEAVLDKEIPNLEIEVVLVESNSTDGTRDDVSKYIGHPRVRVVFEGYPQGKGHAVRRGLDEARGDYVLIQDADLEYDVNDYDRLLDPLRSFQASFVLGVRQSPDGKWGMRHFGERSMLSPLMNVGHVAFLILFNLVYGRWLQDPFTMYKVMRRDCLHGLILECNRFDFDWELTGKLIRAGYTPREIAVSYHSRSFSEGKKVSFFRDPFTWIRACFKHRFSRLYDWD